MNHQVIERWNHLLHEVRKLEEKYGRLAHSVEVLAVSKGQPVDKIRMLRDAGVSRFGESYLQELERKAEGLGEGACQWVFIGHLQSNKLRRIVGLSSEIQSVGSFRHASQIARHAKDMGKSPFPIYLAVNIGDEEQKSGVSPKDLEGLRTRIQQELPELCLRGIMAVPPKVDDVGTDSLQEMFRTLRSLATATGDGRMSAGMSQDLEMAIAHGTDMVRVGTRIFGPR